MAKGNRFGRNSTDSHPPAELISGDQVEGANANVWTVPLAGFASPMYADDNLPGVSTGFAIDDALAIVIAVDAGPTFSLIAEQTLDPLGLVGWFAVSGRVANNPSSISATANATATAFVFPQVGLRMRLRVTALSVQDLKVRVAKEYSALDVAPGSLGSGSATIGRVDSSTAEGAASGTNSAVPIALEARTTQKTAIGNGLKVNAVATQEGKQVVQSSIPDLRWGYTIATGGIITAVNTTIKAAAGASSKNYITSFQLTNGGATATEVEIRLGAAGTVIWRDFMPAGAKTNVNVPEMQGSAVNQLLEFAVLTAGARISGAFQGYTGV